MQKKKNLFWSPQAFISISRKLDRKRRNYVAKMMKMNWKKNFRPQKKDKSLILHDLRTFG